MIIAGETSSDIHASNLIRCFNKKKDIRFFGIGGERMYKEGCEIIYPMEKIEVLGFVEPILKIKEILSAKKRLMVEIKRRKPHFAILVDFPGFNLSFAKVLNSFNIPVFYFVAPQVWAWGRSRILTIRKYVKHVYPILPFEKDIFDRFGIRSSYFGNPLIDIVHIKGEIKREDFKDYEKIVALLPGSRLSEIKTLLPIIVNGFKIFKNNRKILGIVALNNDKFLNIVNEKVKNEEDIKVIFGKTYDILKIADVAVISSGTATLESAIIGTPMVVVYKLSNLSYFIARFIAKLKYASLVNIIMDERVVPELIQKISPKDIADNIWNVFKNKNYIISKFKCLKDNLGEKGVYEKVVDDIIRRI